MRFVTVSTVRYCLLLLVRFGYYPLKTNTVWLVQIIIVWDGLVQFGMVGTIWYSLLQFGVVWNDNGMIMVQLEQWYYSGTV